MQGLTHVIQMLIDPTLSNGSKRFVFVMVTSVAIFRMRRLVFTMTTSDSNQDVHVSPAGSHTNRSRRSLSRREFLRYASLVSGGAILSACAPSPASLTDTAATATPADATAPAAVTSTKLGKAVIAFAGAACEAPTYIAYEKGFFEQEGLQPELIAVETNTLKEGLATGKIDGLQQTADSIKSIEQGLGIRITSGLHRGCIRAVAGVDSGVKTITDLKGKAIGVHAFGAIPMVLVQWALFEAGLDPVQDVTFKIFPPPQLEEAVKKGEVQAFAMYDPFPAIALNNKSVVQLFSSHDDAPYKDMYCCFTGISAHVVENQPEKAAALTRALQNAAYWVSTNQDEAARISVEKKYVPASVELLASLLKLYTWVPNVAQGKTDFLKYTQVLKQVGTLEQDTDPEKLANLAVVQVTPEFQPSSSTLPTGNAVAEFPQHLYIELIANADICGHGSLLGHGLYGPS